MPRYRTSIAVGVAVVLAVAACGGGEGGNLPDRAAGERPEANATPDPGLGDPMEPDASAQDEQQGLAGAAPDDDREGSTSGTIEPQDSTPEVIPPWTVRPLGDRFEWCARVQQRLDDSTHAQSQLDAAAGALQQARDTYEGADDELDRAELRSELEGAEQLYDDLQDRLVYTNQEAAALVRPGIGARGETEAIALERSHQAYAAVVNPSVVRLAELAYPGDRWQIPGMVTEYALEEPMRDEEQTHTEEPLVAPIPMEPSTTIDYETVVLHYEWTLSSIAGVQTRTFEASDAIAAALRGLDTAISSLSEAELASDAIAAHQSFEKAMRELDDASARYDTATDYWAIREHEILFVEVAQSALDTGELSEADFNAFVSAIQQSIQTLGFSSIADQLPPWVTKTQPGGPVDPGTHAHWGKGAAERLGRWALRAAADRFLLDDTGAMAVFWGSLSESCES